MTLVYNAVVARVLLLATPLTGPDHRCGKNGFVVPCFGETWWNPFRQSFPLGQVCFPFSFQAVCVCVCSVVASMCIRCMLSACCLCLRTWGTVLVSEWLVTIVRNVCHTQTAEPATWSHESHPARPHRRRSERILNTCVFRL